MQDLASPLLPVAPCSGCLIQTTNKTKIEAQSSTDKSTTSFSLTNQKEKQTNKQKNSTNLTLYKAYTNQWINIRRAETKRRKEFNLEAWKKETSNITSLKKIMKGKEILHK